MESSVTRILVVDDNPGDARLVEYALQHEPDGHFACERASRIAQALERLARPGVDAILLDLGLPDSQGAEGLRRIRAVAPKVPVVVLTGSQNPDLIRAAIAGGAEDYLVKGIFPKGYLAWVLRVAILFRQAESALTGGGLPDPKILAELSDASTGVAIFPVTGPALLNEAFEQLTGYTTAGAGAMPEWLAGLIDPLREDGSGGSADRGAGPRMDLGEFSVDRPSSGPVRLEYVIRRFPLDNPPRSLLFLREISRERRAPDRRPRTEREPTPVGASPVSHGPLARVVGPASGEVLDPATWNNLRELAGADTTFLPSLIDAFDREGRRLVGGLQSAIDSLDFAAVGRLAHTLKSTCAQVGALPLAARLAELEYASETGNVAVLRAMILEDARDFDRVRELLRKRYPRR